MAKTVGNLDSLFWSLQRQAPARVIAQTDGQVIGLKYKQVSRKKKKRLREQSPLKLASVSWKSLTPEQREDWGNVAEGTGLTGWQLFIQRASDQQRRGPTVYGSVSYASGFFGYGSEEENLEPGELALYKVGNLQISSGDDPVILVQDHPDFYNLRRVIPGSKKVFETVEIEEQLLLPLEIKLSYHTDMTATGDLPQIGLKIIIETDDEGIHGSVSQRLDFGLQTGWTRGTLEISEAPGVISGYSLQLFSSDCIGLLQFDNLEINHSGTNWGIDPSCNDVNQVVNPDWGDINRPWVFETGQFQSKFESKIIDELILD